MAVSVTSSGAPEGPRAWRRAKVGAGVVGQTSICSCSGRSPTRCSVPDGNGPDAPVGDFDVGEDLRGGEPSYWLCEVSSVSGARGGNIDEPGHAVRTLPPQERPVRRAGLLTWLSVRRTVVTSASGWRGRTARQPPRTLGLERAITLLEDDPSAHIPWAQPPSRQDMRLLDDCESPLRLRSRAWTVDYFTLRWRTFEACGRSRCRWAISTCSSGLTALARQTCLRFSGSLPTSSAQISSRPSTADMVSVRSSFEAANATWRSYGSV